MLIRNYPEDSTLRRHADSAAAFRLQAFLEHGPTDSTLRRHFEQMMQASASASASASAPAAVPDAVESAQVTPAAAEAAPAKPVATAGTGTSQEPAAPAKKGGFFGWLSRLFGS
jgi:hypothetical protein